MHRNDLGRRPAVTLTWSQQRVRPRDMRLPSAGCAALRFATSPFTTACSTQAPSRSSPFRTHSAHSADDMCPSRVPRPSTEISFDCLARQFRSRMVRALARLPRRSACPSPENAKRMARHASNGRMVANSEYLALELRECPFHVEPADSSPSLALDARPFPQTVHQRGCPQ